MKNNNKLYQYIIVGLVCLNIFVIAFLLFNKPSLPENKNDRFRKPPHHILELSAEQEESFHALVEKHENESKSLIKEQRKMIRKLLLENIDQTEKEQIELEIQELEIRKINSLTSHFEAIKKILTKEQIQNFNPFRQQVVKNILSPRPPNRRPKLPNHQRRNPKN